MKKTELKKTAKGEIQIPDLEVSYSTSLPALNALRREAEFTLSESLSKSNIKIHQIAGRVKSLPSIMQKANDKQIKYPLNEVNDLVGIRVICLFRGDIPIIDGVINSIFNVISVDDKINADTETFGYMSNHYICVMRSDYAGPRYDQIKDKKFEIQVRTLGMHAWAAISHYLSYKGDWDIPNDMKKSLNALSGLFYIADNEFQKAYSAREESLSSAVGRMEKSYDEPLNLDSMIAYLAKKYPDRRHSPSDTVSELVKELHEAGYSNIDEINRDIERSVDAFAGYERDRPPYNSSGNKFADVGVVRGSLRIVSNKFRNLSKSDSDKYSNYEHLIKN